MLSKLSIGCNYQTYYLKRKVFSENKTHTRTHNLHLLMTALKIGCKMMKGDELLYFRLSIHLLYN